MFTGTSSVEVLVSTDASKKKINKKGTATSVHQNQKLSLYIALGFGICLVMLVGDLSDGLAQDSCSGLLSVSEANFRLLGELELVFV